LAESETKKPTEITLPPPKPKVTFPPSPTETGGPLEIIEPPPQKPSKILEMLMPLAEKLEAEYRKQKNREIEDLHNEIADVIDKAVKERKVHISHILTALEMIKHELVIESLRREGLIKTG